MTIELFISIAWWTGTICGILIVGSLVFSFSMFLIAHGIYIIPKLQSKIDLKQIASDKFENKIYIDEAKYVLAKDEWNEKIDDKRAELDEIQSDIRKAAAQRKSINAELEREEKKNAKKPGKKTEQKTTEKVVVSMS